MLDLQPRIDLDEGKAGPACAGFLIEQKFERAEVFVARRHCELPGCIDNARAQPLAQRRTGCDLDELLVAPLHGAFALPEMADCTMAVADDLHFDVAGFADPPLDKDLITAKRRLGLRLAARESFL